MEFYGSIHNHTDRSNFRLRDSTNQLDKLCWYAAKDLQHDFIAITDHETIATAIDCQKVEKKIREEFPNFKIIRGNEIYLCRNGLNKENYERGTDRFWHWILLAKDAIGHEQIREISTRAWSRCFKNGKMIRVPTYYDDLKEIIYMNPGHVIMSTACRGSKISTLILEYAKNPEQEKYDYILRWLRGMAEICGKENFFLEVQPSYDKEQILINQTYKKISEEIGFPVVISLDAHYLKKEDEPIHHAFLTAQEGERETSEFYASTYMMSREEIHEYMDKSIGVETVSLWLNNTKKIYDLCEDYDLTKPLHIPYLPLTIDTISKEEFNSFKDKIKELEYFYTSEYDSNRHLAAAIIRKIINKPDEYNNERTFQEIDDNLKAIRLASEKMSTQWSAYLLNLRDYCNVIWEKGNSFMGPARGCFYPTEKVLLANGQEREIQYIQKGDLIINHNGSINKVLNTLSYDVDETCYIIKGKGKEPIHCTYNHKFWIKQCKRCENPSYKNSWCKETCRRHNKCSYEKNHEAMYIPANQIEIGDMLAYPKPKLPPLEKKYIDLSEYLTGEYYFIEDDFVGYYVGNNRVKKGKILKRFITIDTDLAYLCGVFIGDGWTRTNSECEIGIAFNSETEKDLKSLERCIAILHNYGLETTLVKSPTRKLIQLKFYSKVWWHFFRDNFGKDTYEKHICDWLITSNTAITKSLLLGLMASDGHYDKDRICYDSVNLNLIKQIQMLWSSIGIFGNFKIRDQSAKNWHTGYKWTASGKQLEKIKEDFPLIQITVNKKYTRQDYLEDENCFYTIVESITTESYKGKVYDLTIENIPSYVINGSGVHNSGTGFLLLNMLDVTQINPLRETTKTYSFRFLNPERVSVLDVDLDIEGGKRPQVYSALQETYGTDRVSKVLTIRTEKSKSALLTACRGLNVDPDEAAYLASFIKADRGTTRTLAQTFYGDVEEDIPADKKFQELMTQKYPKVWEVAQYIEGLCCGVGSHAGGVIFYDEPITKSTALMCTSNGDVCTQFDLHTCEDVS